MIYTKNGEILVNDVDTEIKNIFEFLQANTKLQGDFNDFKNTNLFAITQLFAQYIYIQKNSIVADLTYKFLEINNEYQENIISSVSNNWYKKFLDLNILLQMQIKDNSLYLYLKDLSPLATEVANNNKIANVIKNIVQFPPISALKGTTSYDNVAWTLATDKAIELQITINLGGIPLQDTDVQDIIATNFRNCYKFGTKITHKLLLQNIDYLNVDIKAGFKNSGTLQTLALFIDNLDTNFILENNNDIKVILSNV